MALRFVIIGGGPAGVAAATYAARLGADVVLIERDVIGGAANLWDCVPSKAMIATGTAMSRADHSAAMGFATSQAKVDLKKVKERIQTIIDRLSTANLELRENQERKAGTWQDSVGRSGQAIEWLGGGLIYGAGRPRRQRVSSYWFRC